MRGWSARRTARRNRNVHSVHEDSEHCATPQSDLAAGLFFSSVLRYRRRPDIRPHLAARQHRLHCQASS
ncbi:MAG: hypothetical protein C0406_06065 [Sideroxydans sp.]|nr:hypothetical protein [Sideroxydans sp.]